MRRLSISPLAEQDIEDLADYIAQDSPARALSFVRSLHDKCRWLAQNPTAHRLRPELGHDLRSCPYGNYVIFFHATSDEVTIIRVLHGARDLPSHLGTGLDEQVP